MNAYENPSLQDELAAIGCSVQAIAQRLLTATHDVENDRIVNIAQPADIPCLKALSIPGTGHSVDQAIEDAFGIFSFRARVNHTRFLAFVPGPAHPISWLGDCISSAFNSFAGSRIQGSGVAVVEKELTRWLASKAGLPDTASGVFVSGGSYANLTAMAVARNCIPPSGKKNLGVAYLSDQTHYSVAKALRVLGFKHHQIRIIPSDADLQMDTSQLVAVIQTDHSISWDAHKWLFQTYDCSLILVKDRKNLLNSFGNNGDYLRDAFDDEAIPNFWNYGIELTRPARAMKLWFTLRVLGVDTIGRMIDQGFLQAERAEEELGEHNRAISQRPLSENVAAILTTKLRGSVVLRICSISPFLTVEGMARKVHQHAIEISETHK
ncbi:hypothetical protein ACJ41O_005905 [Fusarium nematophilum]